MIPFSKQFKCATLLIMIFAFNITPTQSFISLDDAFDIIKVGKDVVVTIAKTWHIVDENFDFSEAPLPLLKKTEQKLFTKMELIQNKIEELNSEIHSVGTRTITSFMRTLPERMKLELRLHTLLDHITRISVFYKRMQFYVNTTDIERVTLQDYAKTVTSHGGESVGSLLERIHTFVSSSEKGLTDTEILTPIANVLEEELEGDMMCSTSQSPQQVLYNLYNTIALTELKGYIMMQFSYMLLRLYNEGNFTKEAQLVRDQYERRTSETITSVKKVMETASRQLWRCDPKKHVHDETYIQVTQLLQGYIQNEVDLNPEGTCRESCSEYTYTKSHGCFKNLYCRQQRQCNGKIINCRYVDSDMSVCPAEVSSGRRYEYVEYENGRVLGRKQNCNKGSVKVDSWWRWLFWHCSYCFCLCDEQGVYSDRYISMQPAISDIKNNMVVTGLSFVKVNRVIHLQIQEGKLLPRGNIDPKTVRWVPVNEYSITDRNIFNGQDYHTLTWEQRSMDLDDLIADDRHVLTGIRFKRIGSHINFEIYETPFDFETGRLLEGEERSIWKDNSNTEASLKNPRTELRLHEPDISIRSPNPSIPDSKSDMFVEFTNTGIDRDAAQTTVPFFDAQPVESLLPVPLSGAGIYHKGQKNFGGFIGVKVFTYDLSKHLHAASPDEVVIN